MVNKDGPSEAEQNEFIQSAPTQLKIETPFLHKFQHSGEIDNYELLKPEKRKSGHAAFGEYKFNNNEDFDEKKVEPFITPTKRSTADSSLQGDFGKVAMIT